MRNIGLSMLIEMALQPPPATQDDVEPVLLFLSTALETNQRSYSVDIEENLTGRFINDTTFRTFNGWTVIIRHAKERPDVLAFERAIRERQDYHVVETWSEVTLSNPEKNIPRLLDILQSRLEQQTRH